VIESESISNYESKSEIDIDGDGDEVVLFLFQDSYSCLTSTCGMMVTGV